MRNIYTQKALFLVFIVVEIALYFIMTLDKQSRIEEYLADTSRSFDAEYNIVLNAFEDKAKIVFNTLINKERVKSLFKQGLEDSAKRDIFRQELYVQLLPEYEKLKKYGFKQVHFHTSDNHSYLRMHAPEHFGDDLSSFRETVAYVNKSKQKISGFEEGVAYNGYRFVFPLFDKEDYLGSVELSFSAYALAEYINTSFLETRFIIAKEVLIANGHEKLEDYYVTSGIDENFVIDRRYEESQIVLPYNKRLAESISHEKEGKRSFSIEEKVENKRYIETFISVENPITKQLNAYLVIISNGKYIGQIEQNFWVVYSAVSFVVFLLFLRYIMGKIFYKKIQSKNQELAIVNDKLKTILDSQDDLIIITDGKKMVEANAKVLEFFGYETLDRMRESHQCICEFFIRHDDYFHLGLIERQQDWIYAIAQLSDKERIVNMTGHDMVAKAFQVKVNEYGKDGQFVISFSDITNMLIEQRVLEYQAHHDKLTDIYNRQKIDEELIKRCQYSSQRKEEVGLILVDIDNFKKINDTYGHNVGDQVLVNISKLLKAHVRDEDILGRWGGEEFIIIMRFSSFEETYQKAESLRKKIEAFEHKALPNITASFGITPLRSEDTPEKLFQRADFALYDAKQRGKNCVIPKASSLKDREDLGVLSLANND